MPVLKSAPFSLTSLSFLAFTFLVLGFVSLDSTMKLAVSALILCLSLTIGRCTEEIMQDSTPQPEESYFSDWGIGTIRDGFEAVNGYLDFVSELLGGKNGVCQYRCRYGKAPMPRPNYKSAEPNGCSSYFLGLKLDMGIPAMTKCCNQLDICYDTCGANKYRCDAKFRWCLQSICSDLKRSLGFVSKVEACESIADTVFRTIRTLGCRPFMNSQRSACICNEEERDEL
ncbi:group XIIB secretory phospholipase A2-like protein isoform X2 [Anolis carolinensis]|uniref:Group XIIB secretory phospholipase A2-like protein n=1 Tax=Anolis carolinensis TaxID=28377 RepID=A0A803SS01_ANOCA|nr:PREDICTED: group XIIB secretory phospholipase A2-like protein isoform X2 [Anolis carolinensis]|eukprot:XP_008104881.1 PREDICTED: group XIIB secretory phospholipase A2-like protein isoform X2 [Anolis carolinensis]